MQTIKRLNNILLAVGVAFSVSVAALAGPQHYHAPRSYVCIVATQDQEKKGDPGENSDEDVVVIQDMTVPQPRAEALFESNEIFGYSVQGRPLWAHVLGDGPNVTLMFAAVHGNETSTPYLVRQLHAHLKRHPGRLQGRRVVLV